eukprot:2845401-Pyramimonas_sp.AAC.1
MASLGYCSPRRSLGGRIRCRSAPRSPCGRRPTRPRWRADSRSETTARRPCSGGRARAGSRRRCHSARTSRP